MDNSFDRSADRTRFGQHSGLFPRADIGSHGIFGFTGRLQHGFAIGDQGLLQNGILNPDVVPDPAVVKKRPDE